MTKAKAGMEKQLSTGSELWKYLFAPSKKELLPFNPTDIPLSIYTEMLNDGGVLFPLLIIKLPIIRNKWHYDNPNKDIEAFVRKNLKTIWGKLIVAALTAVEYGFSAFEKRFQESDGLWWYKTFIDLMPEYVKIRITNDGSFDGLHQNFPTKEEVDIPKWKSLVFSHDKKFGNLYGRSRLRSVYRYWLIDKSAYNYHAIAMQDFAVPTAVGRAPSGQIPVSTKEDGTPIMKYNLDFMQEIAESIHSRSALTFPSDEGWKLDLLSEGQKTVHWDFIKDHVFFDKMKARAIFVPESVVFEDKGGSYAKAEVQSRWLEKMIESIQVNLAEEYIEPFIINPLINLNFFNGTKQPPLGNFYFSPLVESDREFIQKVFMKTFSEDKFEIDWNEMARVFGLPIKVKASDNDNTENMISRITRELRSNGKISELDKKFIGVEMRRAYNSGIEDIKRNKNYDGYVTAPPNDIVLIDREKKLFIERLQSLPQSGNINEMADHALKHNKLVCKKLGEDAALKFIEGQS